MGLVVIVGKQNDVGVEKQRSGGAHRGNTRARMCIMHMTTTTEIIKVLMKQMVLSSKERLTSVLLGKSIPKGNSRITSVTLKLGDSPGGVPCNKWAVVVCKKLKNYSGLSADI